MSTPVVDVQNLVKWYGPRLAVRDVSFSVAEGEVVGLLGPNGSGKSTIFRILTGYLVPTSGSVAVAGHDATTQSLALRHEVGYVPEDAPLYDHMRVNEFLKFMAQLKGLFGRSATRAIGTLAERLHLEEVAGVPIGKLSRGFRQRVAIGQALLNGRLLTTDALALAVDGQRLRLQVAGPEPMVREAIAAVPGVRSIVVEPESGGPDLRYLVEADQRPEVAQQL